MQHILHHFTTEKLHMFINLQRLLQNVSHSLKVLINEEQNM